MTNDFDGYDPLHYTQVPDALFDQQLSRLSHAELKVVLWIMRCTFGWKKERDAISLTQLQRATGLSRQSVAAATQSLERARHIIIERRTAPSGDAAINVYRLRIRGEIPGSSNQDPQGSQAT